MARSILRSISRVALLGVFAFASFGMVQKPVIHKASVPTPMLLARNYYPQARMRKMHLFRPDLLLYPVFFDVYC